MLATITNSAYFMTYLFHRVAQLLPLDQEDLAVHFDHLFLERLDYPEFLVDPTTN